MASQVRDIFGQKVSQRAYFFATEVVEKAGILDEKTQQSLVEALAAVSRSSFVEKAFRSRAFEDVSLPIAYEQKLIPPSVLARVLGLAGVKKGMRVMQIGCEVGYCSALMSHMGVQVFCVESIGLLAQKTRRRLDEMGFQNVLIRRKPVSKGWSEYAPYDAIVSLYALEELPQSFKEQLSQQSGKIICPLIDDEDQKLCFFELRDGKMTRYELGSCNFVEHLGE